MSKSTTPAINVNLIVETVSENIPDELPDASTITRLATETEIKRDYDQCFYCDGLVRRSSKLSGDHFPIPKRHGGTIIVPCCQSCHDMKDRFDIYQWPAEWLPVIINDFPNLNRETRIFLAKALALVTDTLVRNRVKPSPE